MEIKSRFDGRVLFSFETNSMEVVVEAAIKSGANLWGADLGYANLRGANLGYANLRGAYLRGADLGDVYLRGADLGGADLQSAKLADDVTINKTPIQLLGLLYDVLIFDEHIKIGCEFHSMAEWFSFDYARINKMDRLYAVKWWRQWKEPLKQICLSSGRYEND